MKSCTTLFLCFSLLCFQDVLGGPIVKGVEDIHIVTPYLPSYATVLISLGALLLCAYFILGCVCCPNKSIKALSYQNGFPVSRLNENTFENNTEITIFPPHSTVIDLQPVSPSFPGFDDKVTFEPLPDILPKNFMTGQSAACSSRPAHFNALLKSKISLHDWFDDPNSNFPREQLQYLQEIGIGWFGRVVEGEASQICDNEEKTSVIVKILREEASPSEHLHFLHEVRPYRDLKHSNIIKLLGRCLESDPFLLIMEHSTCDLKTYLSKKETGFLQNELMLQMICNIASGLKFMHDRGFCHMDLAAHNCFVSTDNIVKIGDYGISFDRWKCDYYCLGDIALPIRWYSPEILRCSETTIETKEITREANIWAFGVVLWEIAELGKLPYENLSDEDVLQKVLIDKILQLSPPTSEMICKDEIVLIMRECWRPKRYRPPMEKIENFITQLYNDHISIKKQELSFEERWNALQPRITEISSYTGTESSSLKFENDFSTRSDLQNYSSDNELLSSFEMSFDILPKSGFNGQLSPSLNVLNGSIDELTDNDAYLNSISLSCGKYADAVDADTLSNISDKENFQMEEDKENANVNNMTSEQVSAAIRDLDLVLANQPDSSRNSTQQESKPMLEDPDINTKDKAFLINGIFKDTQYLNKSSDLSNISENSFSKSSNFSEHVDQEIKSTDLSANSDLNGNCSFYDNVSWEQSDANSAEFAYESDQFYNRKILFNNYQDENVNVVVEAVNELYNSEDDNKNFEIEHANHISVIDSNKLPSVPDIVIHEISSVKAAENLEDCADSETVFCIKQNQNQQKSFRFVFKDEQNEAEVNRDFNEELAHELSVSLKTNGESKPLTSTPVRSSSDSKSCSDTDINKENISNEVFCDSNISEITNNIDVEIPECKSKSGEHIKTSVCPSIILSEESSNFIEVESKQDTLNSTNFDQFTTAQSSLFSNDSDSVKTKVFQGENLNEIPSLNHLQNDITISFTDNEVVVNQNTFEDLEPEKSNTSNTSYVSADSSISREDHLQVSPDVISPPNGYVSSPRQINLSNHTDDGIENKHFEHNKSSDTVSPPQGFQDDGLAALNDSYSESKASFDPDLSTSAECGSSENLDHYLEDDHVSHENISSAQLLESSFPDEVSKSFVYETCADFSGNMRPRKHNSSFNFSHSDHKKSKSYHSDYEIDGHENYMYENINAPIPSYDHMIVEDLNTGEQTVINESYSLCDDYENSGESDEILKINTETDEAIIVDSSEALIGFVPSRSIELLQEFEVIPPLNQSYILEEEKESSDSMNIDACSPSPSPGAMKHNSSPYESPEPAYPQPYRNFCLQNEVIEEEITDEIVSPSSCHSSSSYCSNEIYNDEEKMSQSSESAHHREMYETSVMPSMDHLYVVSDDGLKTDVSSSDCSPIKQHEIVNTSYKTDSENNHIEDEDEGDIMHSFQPSQCVRWLSDETLEVDGDRSPIIIEGREILAGDIIQNCELTAEDITSALNLLDIKSNRHAITPDHLNVSQSPSPFSSVESSPCRDIVYTPDFESDSEETGSGTSCSSTSGSFECIHNKFKDTIDISKVADESDKSASSREQSPMKIFSKTWDCHATPTKGVLVTPEKKFNSMRKSVSFHEEDPHVVFEYPPASDSSEDGYPSDDNEQFSHNIDYLKYADWDLQVNDTDDNPSEEIVEIEELDSEPYVRRPVYSRSSVGPLNRPMLYTLTAGFSDEDFDLSDTTPPCSLNAPSNSPDEEKQISVRNDAISEMIEQHLSNLVQKEKETKAQEDVNSNQNFTKNDMSAPVMSVQESATSSIDPEDIVIDEILPDYRINCESVTVHKDDVKSSIDKSDDSSEDEEIEEVIIEELSEGESASDSFEFKDENKPIVLETDVTYTYDKICMKEIPEGSEKNNISDVSCIEIASLDSDILDSSKLNETGEKMSPKCSSEIVIEPLQENENGILDEGVNTVLDKLNANKNSNETITSLETNFAVSHAVGEVLNKEGAFSDYSISQNSVANSEKCINDRTDLHETYNNVTNFIADKKSDISNTNGTHFYLSENPVHSEFLESSSDEQSNYVLDNTCHVSKILTNANKFKLPFESDILRDKEDTSKCIIPSLGCIVPGSVNSTVKEIHENACSNAENVPTEHNENLISFEKLSNDEFFDKLSEMDTNIPIDTPLEENLESDKSALINILDEGSSPLKNSFAQNITQSVKSSNSALADLSDIFCPQVNGTDGITDVQSSKTLCNSESKITSESEASVNATSHSEKETLYNSTCSDQKCDNVILLKDVPKIIVTPASESDVEDELEEYLRGQLKHFHSETAPQEDFSVTSEFSSRPFEDVFGSYFSGESSDYIEAFNFEFENGNFFDDYIDDYPRNLQTGVSGSLFPDNGRQKRSSSLPLMTENLSDEENLTVKSDSSLVNDSSKSITRL